MPKETVSRPREISCVQVHVSVQMKYFVDRDTSSAAPTRRLGSTAVAMSSIFLRNWDIVTLLLRVALHVRELKRPQ